MGSLSQLGLVFKRFLGQGVFLGSVSFALGSRVAGLGIHVSVVSLGDV